MSEDGTGQAGRALLIGYGNPYLGDDGVALHILNMVRERRGDPPLPPNATGEDDLGGPVDTLMAHQLLPELAPLLDGYGRVIFVDAHTGAIEEDVRIVTVEEEKTFQAVVHHMTPGLLLHYARLQNGRAPAAWLVSVRGYEFDFSETITDRCRAHVDAATEVITLLLR